MRVKLSDIVIINPGVDEDHILGNKFIPMDLVRPFCRDVAGYNTRLHSSGAKFQNGDVLLARITPCLENGKTAFVNFLNSSEAGSGSTEFIVMRAINGAADNRYVYYLATSADFRDYAIKSMVGTSGRQRVQIDALADYELDLPDLATQKKIADTLSAFDDKIELNRQTNETLEEMGRTLFRHYFIDTPEAKNWPMVKVGDVLQSIESGSRPRGGATKSGIPSVGAENVIGLGKYDYSKEKYISVDYFKKLKHGIIQSGDVLLYKDGAYVGKETMFMDGFPHERAAVNEHVFILRTNNRLLSQSYLYYWLDQNWITQKIINAGIAKAAQPGINQRDVECLPILLPPVNETNKFNSCCKLLLSKIFANALESRALAKTRDVLSLKLIN